MTLRRGDRLGEYVVEGPLWPVAGGAWWRVRHHALDDVRAAILVAETEDLQGRLSALARVQDGMGADAVLPIRGIDTGHTPPYLVLQVPRGEWLHDRLQRGPCSAAEARLIIAGICEALTVIHEAGCAHGAVDVAAVHLGEGAAVRLGLAGCGPRASAPAATKADDLRALSRLTFALLTGCEPSGAVGPNHMHGLPDWAQRVIARAQGLDGGYSSAAEVRSDLGIERPSELAPTQATEPEIRFVAGATEEPPEAIVCAEPSVVPRRAPLWWRLFWLPPQAVSVFAGVLLPFAIHLTWVGLAVWGVHTWVTEPTAPEATTVSQVTDERAREVLEDFVRLGDGAHEDLTRAARALARDAAERPGAFQRAVQYYTLSVLEEQQHWKRRFRRLELLQPPERGMVLAGMERITDDLQQAGRTVDKGFLDHLRQLRQFHEGERF